MPSKKQKIMIGAGLLVCIAALFFVFVNKAQNSRPQAEMLTGVARSADGRIVE